LRRGSAASYPVVVPKGQPTAPEIASTVRRRFLRDICVSGADAGRDDVTDRARRFAALGGLIAWFALLSVFGDHTASPTAGAELLAVALAFVMNVLGLIGLMVVPPPTRSGTGPTRGAERDELPEPA
jgi:hypothetical protein